MGVGMTSLSGVKLRAAAAILVAVPALAAAGCGEKDEPPTTGRPQSKDGKHP